MFQSFDPVSDRSFAARHLPALRATMARLGLDGLLVPHDDEYLNEYLPANAERLMWISGFSGSAGFGIVLADRAAIFSDGRYTLQLRDQVDTDHFSLHMTEEQEPASWLRAAANAGAIIGYDPMLFSRASLEPFVKAAADAGFTLQPVASNPIDLAWTDRPAAPCAAIIPHPDHLAGETAQHKRDRISKAVRDAGADAVLLTAPHSLAWLFNIRGGDVHASPLPLGRAMLSGDGSATLFVNPAKVDATLREHLGNAVALAAETEVEAMLAAFGATGRRMLVDPALTPVRYTALLQAAGAGIVEGPDPCALPRATKNAHELAGTRAAHIRDGAVMTRFLHWLADTAPLGELTEIAAAQKLEEMRRETGLLRDVSFDTISGTGAHGAICHYRVTRRSDMRIAPPTLFLIDSGGQYQDGTTDITRTIAVGTPTEEMRKCYTLVLRGHIALATIRFPRGISGHQLDAVARRPLWEAGLDYDHGTGHGVGSYLGVHEGPQNISKRPIRQALMPGMICSNEPGYYKADAFGIRIENLIVVTQAAPVPGGEREMMEFETITLAPLERELIDITLLRPDEIAWVDAYHARVLAEIGPLVPAATAQWLRTRTAPLAG